MTKPQYRHHHRVARKMLLARSAQCYWCGAPNPTVADHDPPLCTVPEGQEWRGVLRPSCMACSRRQAGRLRGFRKRRQSAAPPPSRPW